MSDYDYDFSGCDGCTCCSAGRCFVGVRTLVDSEGRRFTERGDCGVGGEGSYWEGESMCPCTGG